MSTNRAPVLVRFLTNRQAKRTYGKEAFAMKRSLIQDASACLPYSMLPNDFCLPRQTIPPEEFQPSEVKESLLGSDAVANQHLMMLEQAMRDPLQTVAKKTTRYLVPKYKNNMDSASLIEEETINYPIIENNITNSNPILSPTPLVRESQEEVLLPTWDICPPPLSNETSDPFPLPLVREKSLLNRGTSTWQYVEEDEIEELEGLGYVVHEDVDFDDEGSAVVTYRILL